MSGPDNAIYFRDVLSDGVERINPDGTITDIPIPTSDSSTGGIAVGGDGNLYFTESINNTDTGTINAQIGQVILPQASVVASPIPPISLVFGQPLSGVLLSFRDNSPAVSAANFAARINFGDGSGDIINGVNIGNLATVVPDGSGGFVVAINHTYLSPGVYQGTVTISNQAGQIVSSFTVTVVQVVDAAARAFVRRGATSTTPAPAHGSARRSSMPTPSPARRSHLTFSARECSRSSWPRRYPRSRSRRSSTERPRRNPGARASSLP